LASGGSKRIIVGPSEGVGASGGSACVAQNCSIEANN
jgi:hypothetical protein